MPDKTTLEHLEEMLEDSDRRLNELGLREQDPRPGLRLVPTGDDAPPSGDPLLDRLVASVDALAPSGRRRRPKLAVMRGGRDDA
jgi:hypothetical protein